jgi:hypothetical protein
MEDRASPFQPIEEAFGFAGQSVHGLGKPLGAPHHPDGAGTGLGRGLGQPADRARHLVGLMGHLFDVGGDVAGGGVLLLDGAGNGRRHPVQGPDQAHHLADPAGHVPGGLLDAFDLARDVLEGMAFAQA